MFWYKLPVCVAFLCILDGSVGLPLNEEARNELKDVVSSIISKSRDKADDDVFIVPAQVADVTSEFHQQLDEPGYAPEAKRSNFDSISHYSDFGKFEKRKNGESNDVLSGLLHRLKRGGFDSIHHYSDFGRFNKRSVDRAYFVRGYADQPAWKRRAFDSIHHYSDFGRFNRRK